MLSPHNENSKVSSTSLGMRLVGITLHKQNKPMVRTTMQILIKEKGSISLFLGTDDIVYDI